MQDERTDAELVADYLAGDESAFETIFERYKGLVFASAMRSLGDQRQAEEVVANAFGEAAQRLSRLRDTAKLRAWLLAVSGSEIRHLIRSAVRERRRRERVAASEILESIDPNDEDSEYARSVLDLARGSLAPEDQVLLGLVLAGVSGSDLADSLGVDVGAANTRKSRLYDRLRSTIEVFWVSRPRPERCSELAALLQARRDEGMSRATCRAVERHVEECETCEEERRRTDPLALLGLAPLPLFSKRLDELPVDVGRGTSGATKSWRSDGFPRSTESARRGLLVGAATLAALALIGSLLGITLSRHDGPGGTASAIVNTTTTSGNTGSTSTLPETTETTLSVSTTILEPSTTAPRPVTTEPARATTTTTTAIPSAVHSAKTQHHKRHRAPAPLATTTTLPATTLVPSLAIDSPTVDFGSSATTAPLAFHLANGTSAVSWSATANVSWLSVQPTAGTLQPSAASSASLVMDRLSAPTGQLIASVEIVTSAGSGTIAVTATQLAPPSLSGLTASPSRAYCGTPVMLGATVDAPAGASSVTVDYAGQASGSLTMNGSGTAYTATLTSPNCRSGTITWTVTATDTDGKSATAGGAPITVLS